MSDEPQPRLMTMTTLAKYLGYDSAKSVASLVKDGIIPPALPGTRRWDRNAVDAMLDKASGLTKQAG